MTLNGGGSGAGGSRGGGRERERRRGSTPWGPAPPLHRRSMPVDERDLQAALAPGALTTAEPGTGAQGPRLDWPQGSSDSLSSGGSDSDESVYKVLLLGAPGVGKSALARIFGGIEDGPEAEAAGHTYDRSILVDGEEAALMVYDIWEQDGGRWLPGHCMAMGDAYVIVYSVTDKDSFEKASELRVQLRRARQTDDVPIILVGNKSDLRAGPVPSSSTASLSRHQLRCTTMSRRCLRVSCARYACAGTAKRPTHVGKRVLGGERALARRRSASWAASLLETAARWPCVPSPSPATTSPCSRPWGTHCIVQTDGQIGGLAQPTAQGAPGLAQTLGIPHLMVMDRETVLPREVAPSGRQGLGPQRRPCRPMCVPRSSLSPACGAGL
nr:GTP-binding protein RAD isoform X1 [Kogia breviceps]